MPPRPRTATTRRPPIVSPGRGSDLGALKPEERTPAARRVRARRAEHTLRGTREDERLDPNSRPDDPAPRPAPGPPSAASRGPSTARRKLPAALENELRAALADPRRRFGRYVLLSELGHGGFGAVRRAWDPQMERLVAIKVLTRL